MVARSIFEDYCLVSLGDEDLLKNTYDGIIVKIDPKKHGITENEILADHAQNSRTLITHNIIGRKTIEVSADDIQDLEPWKPTLGINIKEVVDEIRQHPSVLEFAYGNTLQPHRFVDDTVQGGIITNRWLR